MLTAELAWESLSAADSKMEVDVRILIQYAYNSSPRAPVVHCCREAGIEFE